MMEILPRHGTRQRYRKLTCRCVACSRQSKDPDKMPTALMWPLSHLEAAVGLIRLKDWYDDATIKGWRMNGLDDYEADEVAVHFGLLPHSVFPGWTEAGIDADVYP